MSRSRPQQQQQRTQPQQSQRPPQRPQLIGGATAVDSRESPACRVAPPHLEPITSCLDVKSFYRNISQDHHGRAYQRKASTRTDSPTPHLHFLRRASRYQWREPLPQGVKYPRRVDDVAFLHLKSHTSRITKGGGGGFREDVRCLSNAIKPHNGDMLLYFPPPPPPRASHRTRGGERGTRVGRRMWDSVVENFAAEYVENAAVSLSPGVELTPNRTAPPSRRRPGQRLEFVRRVAIAPPIFISRDQ